MYNSLAWQENRLNIDPDVNGVCQTYQMKVTGFPMLDDREDVHTSHKDTNPELTGY